jgi:hypothetical protein
MRAARSTSVYDIAHGQNAFRGRSALEAGKPTIALPLLGQAAALDDYNKGALFDKVFTAPGGDFDRTLAAQFLQTPQNVGGNMVTFGPQGWTMGPATEQGKVYQGTVTNNANESAAQVALTNAKAQATTDLAETRMTNYGLLTKAQIALLEARGVAVLDLSAANVARVNAATDNDFRITEGRLADIVANRENVNQTRTDVATANIDKIRQAADNAFRLTEGQLADIVAGRGDTSKLMGARIATETQRTETEKSRGARVEQGTVNDTAKTDATVQSTKDKTQATVNATNAKAAAAGSTNAADTANKQAELYKKIDRVLDSTYSKRTNNNKSWALLNAGQKRSIVDWATQRALDNGGDLVSAISEAEQAHNISGETTEGVKKGWFTDTPTGELLLNGFKQAKYTRSTPSSPVADAVAPQTPKPKAAPAAPAASGGPVKITNDAAGKEAFARLPSGTEFIDPQGNLRRKP